MRRATPPGLRLDAVGAVPAFARVVRGSRGLGFQSAEPPEGALTAAGPDLRLAHGAPTPVAELGVVAGGKLVVAGVPGIAHTLRAPSMEPIHDRRLPGLSRAQGVALSNAALLRAEDGWRAVVLPSLGDIAADLGDGPVALRGDARRLAVADSGLVTEVALPDGGEVGEHKGSPEALCYAEEVLLVASGSAVGPPGTPPAAGSPIVALEGAASAPRAAALHADGIVSIWSATGERVASWTSPLPDGLTIALSADGGEVSLGTPQAELGEAAIARAEDGALVRYVNGARAISPSSAGDGVAVGGDWGVVWLRTAEED